MKNIKIVKGDTKSITIRLKNGDTDVPFEDGDEVVMTVKKGANQTANNIEKIVDTFTNGEAIINLTTEDTSINAGIYLYTIKYYKSNNEIYTIISGNFTVSNT